MTAPYCVADLNQSQQNEILSDSGFDEHELLQFDIDVDDAIQPFMAASGLPEPTEAFVAEDMEDDPDNMSENLSEYEHETRLETIQKLEKLLLHVLSQLSSSLVPHYKGKKIELALADRRKMTSDGGYSTRAVKFPQKTSGASAKPLAQLLRVVEIVHEALVEDIPTTKRDIYYKDVQLFKTQSVVDRLVDDLAATLDVGRADLHVRASAKGLVCGSQLTIHLLGGETMHVYDGEGMLIPPGEEISRFDVGAVLAWVLVVEKEAVFQTLCHASLASHPLLPGPGLIITGKGYPDVATREFVKTLSDNLPDSIPILVLVDADAYGIDILSVYKYGSAMMQHEREKLAARRVRWLGLRTSELSRLCIEKNALIPISKCDEKKALEMLRRPNMPKKWRKELQYMLHSRRKAEIEVLSELPADLFLGGASSEGGIMRAGTSAAPAVSRTGAAQGLVRYLIHKITECITE